MSKIIPSNLSLKDIQPTPRVKKLHEAYFKALPEVCIERARLVTRFHQENGLLDKPRISILDKAKVYRAVLEHREPVVWHHSGHAKGMEPFMFEDRSLFAGSTTSKFKGVVLYPEFLGLFLWPELRSISQRASNPYYLSEKEAEELNFKIFPPWMKSTIHEIGRTRDEKRMQLLERLVFFMNSKTECISHTLPDFSKAVHLGLRAVINEAKEKGAKAAAADQKEFYAAIVEAMEGIIAYSRNLANKAEEMAAKESDSEAKQELLEIARINRKIPESAAGTFREALTAVWICWTAIHLENPNVGLSLGRLDQVLYPQYRKDIDKGTLSVSDAVELVCCLWLKIGDHVPLMPEAAEQLFGGTGSNQAITIGGVKKDDGSDAVNDLTYVMLRATELMKLRDPNLNARYCQEVNSPEYLRRLCEVNINTKATPALHNDKAVFRALIAKGETEEQAWDYGVIGCVEPGSNGRSYGATGAILINLTAALELALFNGRHRHTGLGPKDPIIGQKTGELATFNTFDKFKEAFAEQVRWMAEQTTALNNTLGTVHQDFYPTPILSALFEGPMDKGKDLTQGGAVINSSGVTVIGLADVADSLSAIQKVVFDEKAFSFKDFVAAMNSNYTDGYEALQSRLMNHEKTPKYGNEDPKADGNVTWIIKLLDKAFGEKENYRGGKYRVGYWTMTMHAGFGRLTKALPNGRKANENFTSGITPVSGVTPYLTKTLNSVGGLPVECIASGMAFNIKYTPKDDTKEKMLDNFAASVEAYFDKGGMEIQFNVTDHDSFADAFYHPEKYPYLLVRVSGYTAYFKDLNPQMQKEIIDRTEYMLSTGNAAHHDPFPLQRLPNEER